MATELRLLITLAVSIPFFVNRTLAFSGVVQLSLQPECAVTSKSHRMGFQEIFGKRADSTGWSASLPLLIPFPASDWSPSSRLVTLRM